MTASKRQYHEWVRVHGPDLRPEYAEDAKKNKQVLESDHFKEVCELAGTNPTKRQASKYRRKKGLAYKYGKSK